MKALAIIGCTIGGAAIGGFGGICWGERSSSGNDFGLGSLIYGFCGAFLGGLAGCIISAVVFT